EGYTETLNMLSVLLKSDGGFALTTASVKDALSASDRRRADVVVADIGMPEYNSYTLIGRIRAWCREHGSIVPAIALTAYATSMDRDTVLSAGFQLHMPKPFEPDKLITAIVDLATKYKQSNAG